MTVYYVKTSDQCAAFVRDPFRRSLRVELAPFEQLSTLQKAMLHEVCVGEAGDVYNDEGVITLCASCLEEERCGLMNAPCLSSNSCRSVVGPHLPVGVERLHVTCANVARFLSSCKSVPYAHLTELGLYASGAWGASTYYGTTVSHHDDVSLGTTLSKLPRLKTLALGAVYDASTVAVACSQLRSLVVQYSSSLGRAMPHLTHFACAHSIALNVRFKEPDERELELFGDALSGSSSLTALRLQSPSYDSAVTRLLQQRLPAMKHLLFYACVLPTMALSESTLCHDSLCAKFTNAVGCVYLPQRCTLSPWFYTGVWMRGEARGAGVSDAVTHIDKTSPTLARWVLLSAPGWVFQRVTLALLGFLRDDAETLRFDATILASRGIEVLTEKSK